MLSSSRSAPQRVHDPHDRLVHGQQRLEPLLVVLVDRGRARGVDRRQRLDEARLVGHVGLVEGGVRRQRLAGEAVDVARRRRRRGQPGRVVGVARAAAVGREEGEREEERRARVAHAPDHRQRALGVVVGRVVDRVAVEPVGVEQPVLVQRVAVEEVGRRVDRRVPLAPAGRHLGGVADPVLVQELADVHGPVARPLEPDRQPVALVEPAVAAVRRAVADHAVVVRVLPGEQRRARRAAERVRDEGAFEGGALRGERAPHAAHHAHRLERLVVGHHDHDVGPLGRCRAGARPAGRAPTARRRRRAPSPAGAQHAVERQPAAVDRLGAHAQAEAPARAQLPQRDVLDHRRGERAADAAAGRRARRRS